MHQDVARKITRIVQEQLRVPEDRIKPESSFVDDLGADSLGLVKLTLLFEETFDIDIEDADVEQIQTVQHAIDFVTKHVKAPRSVQTPAR
jgi:acyl carrier protein